MPLSTRDAKLWQQFTGFDNLYLAWRKAGKGKRARNEVAAFELDLESKLLALQQALKQGSYRPGEYRLFTIYERKARRIAAAPFIDRVVHHALMNIIEPRLDAVLIPECYACRKGKGVHAAVDRYQRWSRRYAYVLKMDIQQYFPSIDHRLLLRKLGGTVADERLLRLLALVIRGSPDYPSGLRPVFPGDDLLTPLHRRAGIPIGNLTSQIFANFYLHAFDWRRKAAFPQNPYLRYVDDMFVFGDSKPALWRLAEQCREELVSERLLLHPKKIRLYPVSQGVDVLGYRVWPDRRKLRNDNGYRFARRWRKMAAQYASGDLSLQQVRSSLNAWVGHAQHADTGGLRKALIGQVTFARVPAVSDDCGVGPQSS